jgi:hyperosmotically inducible protein
MYWQPIVFRDSAKEGGTPMNQASLRHPALLAFGLALTATAAQATPAQATITISNPMPATANLDADTATTQRIADALDNDTRIRGQITVSTQAGVVRLSGSVESVAMIYRAIEISRAIEGVRRVNDDALIKS